MYVLHRAAKLVRAPQGDKRAQAGRWRVHPHKLPPPWLGSSGSRQGQQTSRRPGGGRGVRLHDLAASGADMQMEV